jgi:hypothetical protein
MTDSRWFTPDRRGIRFVRQPSTAKSPAGARRYFRVAIAQSLQARYSWLSWGLALHCATEYLKGLERTRGDAA